MVRMSVELPDQVAEALGRIASGSQSTPEALLAGLASRMVAARADLDRMIDEGLADLAPGRVVPHEAVMAELDGWAGELETRRRQAP